MAYKLCRGTAMADKYIEQEHRKWFEYVNAFNDNDIKKATKAFYSCCYARSKLKKVNILNLDFEKLLSAAQIKDMNLNLNIVYKKTRELLITKNILEGANKSI